MRHERVLLFFLFVLFLSLNLLSCGGGSSSSGGGSDPVNIWTWVSGSDVEGQSGEYGTKGVADANNVPGGRNGSVSWIDAEGNLWLFGGDGYDSSGNRGFLNDLWKFDGENWTWVSGSDVEGQSGEYGTKGVTDANNIPGGRYSSVTWIDANGNLWLFGGYGYDSEGDSDYLNDLWKFDPSTEEWTWVSGPDVIEQPAVYGTKGVPHEDNVPGGRDRSVSWIDANGNLWLFGGNGYDYDGYEGYLNDLWKFDPSTEEWTWVSGSDEGGQSGVYGTKGMPHEDNVPGARVKPVNWIDANGNLWLFGGYGYDSVGTVYYLNDLWKFDPSTEEWTWVSGSDEINQYGEYGTKGVADANNVPGARYYAVSWIDANGNLWLFGGDGYDSAGNRGYLNDLWKFDPSTEEWTWVSGSDEINQYGEYGTKGVADANNVPGARYYAVSWIDANGNLWLFGGTGYDFEDSGLLNDLWRYEP